MLQSAEPEQQSILEEQLARLYVEDDPSQSVFRGCTTNPPLSLQAVQADPDMWNEWIDELIFTNPDLSSKEITWLTYKEVVKRGAEMYLPIYTASNGRFGWISGQLDPRLFTETEQMVKDAVELSSLSPNVMIKVPASMQGIQVIEELTARGISTNTTVCFTLPQIMASANAAMRGIKQAEEQGIDLSRWRAVITMMIGRLTENPVLDVQAQRRNIELSWQDKHWYGLAVFQRAYRMLTDGGYASKMLACSMRQGPLVAGRPRFWDVEKLAGGDIVYTCPPYVLEPLFEIGQDMIFKDEINNPIPQDVIDKLLKIPYCLQAYDPNGLELEQFNDHPSTIDTVKAFSKGFSGLDAHIQDRITAQKRQPERVNIN
jgi:transaldolase